MKDGECYCRKGRSPIHCQGNCAVSINTQPINFQLANHCPPDMSVKYKKRKLRQDEY